MAIKFINTNTLSNIANSIRKKGFMSPDEKIKVQDYVSMIISIGNELSGDFVNGGVYIPAPGLTNMDNSFADRTEKAYPVCGRNVIDMSNAYRNFSNLIGSPVCGPNVINMAGAYRECNNITGSPVCGPNVTSMVGTYDLCYNITGSPVCGPNVTSMDYTYKDCCNIHGKFVCGPNVTSMFSTYYDCINYFNQPVCGPNVTSMYSTYYNCIRTYGHPVCGPNVTSMDNTYYNCRNITGPAIIGYNVTRVKNTYYNCGNLQHNVIILSNSLEVAENLFGPLGAQRPILSNKMYIIFSNNNKDTIYNLLLNMFPSIPYYYNASGKENITFTMPYKGYGEIKNVTYECEHLMCYVMSNWYNYIISCGTEVKAE